MTSSVAPGPVAGARPAVAAEPVVELVSIVKRFGHVTAIDGVSLRFLPGQFVAILGPSGCGKTTLLRMIAGFETPTAGDVRIDGSSVAAVPPYRRQVNTVFQHYALFPHMDVASNVGYGLRQRRPAPPRAEQERQVDEALALVRLAGYGRRRSWQLSGGQQQRVALARALINRPRVLLLDEPLGALDLKLRREMQVELKRLQREVGITFVFVTHDQTEALAMADRITVMRDGRVLQDGPPDEVYDAPHDRWTADFIGQMNFIPGVVEAAASDVDVASGLRPWELRTPGGERYRGLTRNDALAPGDRAAIAIRPERLRVRPAGTAAEASGASDGNDAAAGGGAGVANGRRLTGRVVVATYLGDQTELELDVPALGRVLARIPNTQGGGRAPSAGEEVIVDWDDRAARIVSDH